MTAPELKPCPFCGIVPAMVLDDERDTGPDPEIWVECENPDCISTCRSDGRWSEYESVVVAWNTRSSDPSITANAITILTETMRQTQEVRSVPHPTARQST